jgi:prophage antirepressor-like protein
MKNTKKSTFNSDKIDYNIPTEEGLQVFEHHLLGEIRGLILNDKPYYVATDVCNALGYTDTRDAVLHYCDENGVEILDVIDFLGRRRKKKFIDKKNLEKLVLQMKKNYIKPFCK